MWQEYHEATRHSVESLRRSQHVLDWNNMPDPFRHYEGVPVLDLPADPPPPPVPALQVLSGIKGQVETSEGAAFLSQLLFYSAAISAAKIVPSTGYKYALRVNPSSGNLHPTEFHFVTRGLKNWPDGLYHYRVSSHMAEQRATGLFEIPGEQNTAPLLFVLTSIAWREAWKYGNRAYRYCLLDIGHAWQALATAALAMGCQAHAFGCFPDDEVSSRCGFAQDEWPMLLIELRGAIPAGEPDTKTPLWLGGEPNRLSEKTRSYPLIDSIHTATKRLGEMPVRGDPPAGVVPSGGTRLPEPAPAPTAFGHVARRRRSALDFIGGESSMTLSELSAVLQAASGSLAGDFSSGSFLRMYLYVHRVEGLEPGVYRYWPGESALERIRSGDQRVAAAGLSLGQDLAGNACVAFSITGDLERATRLHGDRGYRYVHFEAGAVGHRMYLAAEALGLGATGIGAFFDERVHHYLDLETGEDQAVYHFAIGHPMPDPRLSAGD
ncbi:MAG TPA: SagB/ThcOx family dehydrogenase [Bryobacteraceae bacterium]|nr:SagB/ThcOx family dehydrogenase [Bryobacteraceae bacterium]